MVSSCSLVERTFSTNCFKRQFGKSTDTIKLANVRMDTVGVLEAGNFTFYFDGAEYVRNIQKLVMDYRIDSIKFSLNPTPYDSTRDENHVQIVPFEKLLGAVQTQLKHSDTVFFNMLPPIEKTKFSPKEFSATNYLATNVIYFAIRTGELRCYNKKSGLFEKSLIHKERYNIFVDWDKIYNKHGYFIFDLNRL